MPLFQTIKKTFSNGTNATVFVWKITETLPTLLSDIVLKPESQMRLSSMKSEQHQLGFLSVRHLLAQIGMTDFDLFYDKTGKPFLTNGLHISITHSFEFSAIATCDQNLGIDIEQQRDKIIHISNKFCDSEFDFLDKNENEYVKNFTKIWGAKECVFKIENQKGISFKNHISVHSFDKEDSKMKVLLNFEGSTSLFEMHPIEIENYILVFGIKL